MSDFTRQELLLIAQSLFHRMCSMMGKEGWMFNTDYLKMTELHKKVLVMASELSEEKE